MTDIEVKQSLDGLTALFPSGKYWQHYPSNGNSWDSLLDSAFEHSSHDYYGDCGCNSFYNSIQCAGFALYMAYRVFGHYPLIRMSQGVSNGQVDNNGWKYYTNGHFSGVDLAPGDIVYQLKGNNITHYAIVHYIDSAGNVYFAEALGSDNSRIAWGFFDDGSQYKTVAQIKSIATCIMKAPKSNDTVRYTVQLYRNYSDSDTEQVDTMYLEAGKTYSENGITLPILSRENYRFAGWFTDPVGGTQHTANTTVPAVDYPLYAQWIPLRTVRFYRNYSDSDTVQLDIKYLEAGKTYSENVVTLYTPTRENYRFDGWFTDRVGGTQHTLDTIVHGYDYDLYAHWTLIKTNVNFMRNRTADDDEYKLRLKNTGETFGLLPSYDDYEDSNVWYKFDGWYTAKSGGTKYTEESIVPNVENLYVYAHWQRCAKVYYMRNQSDNDETCESYLQPQGQTFISQCTFDDYETTDAYYKFAGWYSAKVGGILYEDEEITVPLQKELYLYAHWVRYTRVAFNEILYARQPYTRDYPTGLPFGSLSSPHETGYRFDGWFSSWDGGTKYTAQTIVPNMKNMTMYAHWSQIITVYLHDNYSDASPLFIPCYANEPYGDYLDSYHPSREGCEFKGWYTSPDYDDGDLITSSSIIPEDSSLTIHLYAHWTVDVVYNPCGGCMLGKSVYTYDVGALFWKLPEVCCCEEEKYFDGWYTLPNGYGEKISMITAVPDHSITLYANWRPEL